MATNKDTVAYIIETLENQLGFPGIFIARAMFGEYALYVKGKVVALICNDQLYVKILDVSKSLEEICDTDAPYIGAKMHYVVEKSQLHAIDFLGDILIAISDSLPVPKIKKKKVK